jgi:hypothetical protein
VAYDGYATEKTAWLALTPSGRMATAPGQLFLAPYIDRGVTKEPPLLIIEVGAWNVRKLVASEAHQRSSRWTPESYGNQFTWEACRTLEAFFVESDHHGGQAGDGTDDTTALLTNQNEEGQQRRPSAQLRVSNLGLGGSTNSAQEMAEVFTGDCDLATEARIKEYTCSLTLDSCDKQVCWEADLANSTLKFLSESPRFLVTYENHEVSIDTDANTDSLLLCALGFAAAKWASPWLAEEVADEKSEDFVRKELQDAIALSLSLE